MDNLQLQRFELKYHATESVALAARDFVRAYLKPDENGAGQPNLSYPVHSIYLDSPDLELCRQTLSGEKNRFKLRMRFYDESPGTPVFLEIKRRVNNAILKQRCPVSKLAVGTVLQGRLPLMSQVLSTDSKHLAGLERFVHHVAELRAVPKGHVAYSREAWISPHDNSVRVTIDREVRFDARLESHFSTRMNQPTPVFGNDVIIEIKFTNRFPAWFGEFVRIFGLTQGSAAKYADGVVAYGEHKLRAFYPTEQRKIA